jgi:hypothetical protein
VSNYPKTTKKTSGSAALQRVKRNVVWQAGLAVVTVVLTIVIVFAMTSAWYTNIVQTSGLTFEVEEWGFDGKITVYEDPVSAAPGDEGIVHLEVENTSDSISAVSVSVSKGRMNEYREMQKRIYFYVDTQFARNGETMERVYLNSMDSYTYTLFSQGKLTLTEQTHNDALLKWQWVYDMLGYYVLGKYDQGTDTFTELEYLRPVEYDYDEATFEYVTTQTPDPVNAGQTIESVTVELKTVDGETTVEQFLQELSKTDGYKNDIDYENSVADGYYPVDVDTNGYGVYVYLCSYAEIEMATQYDTQMGMAAKEPTNLAAYQAQLTVSARKNDDNIITVSTLQGLNTAMELANGAVVQLTEDVTLPGVMKLGQTVAEPVIDLVSDRASIEELYKRNTQTLEDIYPVHATEDIGKVETFSFAGKCDLVPANKVTRPKVLIPVFPGTNCEYDSARAVEKAGAEAEVYVIRNLTAEDVARSVEEFSAKVIRKSGKVEDLTLYVKGLTAEEKEILLAGCLMNYYKLKNANA